MNRRKIVALAVVLGVGGLGLAARELLSFQIDSAGAKGLARAVIGHKGSELGIDTDSQKKVTELAEFGIDQAVPHLLGLYQDLSAIEKAGADGDVKGRFESLAKGLQSLVDVKDRVVAEAGKTLAPKERAQIIVKVGGHLHDQFHPTPETTEALIASARGARQQAIKGALNLSDARAKELAAAMDTYAAQRKDLRAQRRDAFAKVKSAVAANNDAAIAVAMTGWDKLTAKASEITRAQIAHAGKLLTVSEKVALVVRAKTRIDRVMRIAALIGKFAPVR